MERRNLILGAAAMVLLGAANLAQAESPLYGDDVAKQYLYNFQKEFLGSSEVRVTTSPYEFFLLFEKYAVIFEHGKKNGNISDWTYEFANQLKSKNAPYDLKDREITLNVSIKSTTNNVYSITTTISIVYTGVYFNEVLKNEK